MNERIEKTVNSILTAYSVIKSMEFAESLTEEQRMLAAGLIGGCVYFKSDTVSEADLEKAIEYGEKGVLCVGECKVRHNEHFGISARENFLGFILQVEALMYRADYRDVRSIDIISLTLRDKSRINKAMEKKLK